MVIKTNVFLPQAEVTLADFDFPASAICFFRFQRPLHHVVLKKN
jgi:hypothetical protein